MRDQERKEVLELFAKFSSHLALKHLKESFDRKGFLSKRELKELHSLISQTSSQPNKVA